MKLDALNLIKSLNNEDGLKRDSLLSIVHDYSIDFLHMADQERITRVFLAACTLKLLCIYSIAYILGMKKFQHSKIKKILSGTNNDNSDLNLIADHYAKAVFFWHIYQNKFFRNETWFYSNLFKENEGHLDTGCVFYKYNFPIYPFPKHGDLIEILKHITLKHESNVANRYFRFQFIDGLNHKEFLVRISRYSVLDIDIAEASDYSIYSVMKQPIAFSARNNLDDNPYTGKNEHIALNALKDLVLLQFAAIDIKRGRGQIASYLRVSKFANPLLQYSKSTLDLILRLFPEAGKESFHMLKRFSKYIAEVAKLIHKHFVFTFRPLLYQNHFMPHGDDLNDETLAIIALVAASNKFHTNYYYSFGNNFFIAYKNDEDKRVCRSIDWILSLFSELEFGKSIYYSVLEGIKFKDKVLLPSIEELRTFTRDFFQEVVLPKVDSDMSFAASHTLDVLCRDIELLHQFFSLGA